jgi:hypothetical protein
VNQSEDLRGEVLHWNRILNDSFDFVYIFADLGLIDFAPSDLSDFYSKVTTSTFTNSFQLEMKNHIHSNSHVNAGPSSIFFPRFVCHSSSSVGALRALSGLAHFLSSSCRCGCNGSIIIVTFYFIIVVFFIFIHHCYHASTKCSACSSFHHSSAAATTTSSV